ncbi:uncharacterized protein LOC111346804 isoform X1 [Stylophora pistillata]|uniref:uncharacterized protein LOC111346804 isoform X1 n=1 Tax=Stylophora pistillata TaxID=50429 RepID=UPI000C0398D7|nr:uncharacterized protein LOC111346804 isoform X1 [Stylophora pistillata]
MPLFIDVVLLPTTDRWKRKAVDINFSQSFSAWTDAGVGSCESRSGWMLRPNVCLFILVFFVDCVSANEQCRKKINIQGEECRSILFKEPMQDKVMKGHLIRILEVPRQGSCNVLCYMEPNCVSINVGPSQGGNYNCELNNASDESPGSSDLQSKRDYIHISIENPCSSSPCFNNGTCQAGYTDKGFRCKCPSGFTGVYCKKACSFDFENGIGGWEMTGRAFIYQPTFGDNPVARERESAQQQGHWWIGGAEKRSNESDPAGKQHPAGADPPNGTLTSPCFRIVGKNISFLIGGGCTVSEIRAELIVNSQVVRKETGNCNETMYRKGWDVEEFIGQYAQVRLVDKRHCCWGHINFDDLKGDIICPHDLDEKN